MPVTMTMEQRQMVVALSGELDHHGTERMREEIDAMAEKEHPPELVLDFGRVEFMDSSGIGLVLGRYRLMQELGGRLILRNLPPHIRRVMRVAGIENLEIREEGTKE